MSNPMDNYAVSLTKCFYCGEDHEIVMTSKLTPKSKEAVEAMQGKVVDMSPCNECKERMEQGVILLTIDPYKSDKDWHKPPDDENLRKYWMPNPYRTGGYFVVTDVAIQKWINDEDLKAEVLKRRWMFIEHEVANMLGLFEIVEGKGK